MSKTTEPVADMLLMVECSTTHISRPIGQGVPGVHTLQVKEWTMHICKSLPAKLAVAPVCAHYICYPCLWTFSLMTCLSVIFCKHLSFSCAAALWGAKSCAVRATSVILPYPALLSCLLTLLGPRTELLPVRICEPCRNIECFCLRQNAASFMPSIVLKPFIWVIIATSQFLAKSFKHAENRDPAVWDRNN